MDSLLSLLTAPFWRPNVCEAFIQIANQSVFKKQESLWTEELSQANASDVEPPS